VNHAKIALVTSPLDVHDEGPVRIVTICRPERRNAVDSATAIALLEAFSSFDADDTTAVAVLTGQGGPSAPAPISRP